MEDAVGQRHRVHTVVAAEEFFERADARDVGRGPAAVAGQDVVAEEQHIAAFEERAGAG